ncbi:MAG: hypothetical protein HOV87_05555 [Catenulispora sp.]|nr:hypothetical protein [Catenulispora sp.]
MPVPAARIVNRVIKRVPTPLLRWGLWLAAKLLLPLAGAAAAAALERLRARSVHRTDPEGTVVVEIDRDLRDLAPTHGNPAEPLAALAQRAYLTLASVPGRSATCLRAVPKRAGDDIRHDVALAKHQLDRQES